MLEFLIERIASNYDKTALVSYGKLGEVTKVSYSTLMAYYHRAIIAIDKIGISKEVVMLEGDFDVATIALLLALIERRNIIVPEVKLSGAKDFASKKRRQEIAVVGYRLSADIDGVPKVLSIERGVDKPDHYQKLIGENAPGLVLFSSGSTGEPKAAVHDFSKLLEKFKVKKQQKTMISFLLFDHIGGLNTLLYVLSNGGTLVTLKDRSPEKVCKAIEENRVEILPTSPTFLNLLLVSGAHNERDLSSLQTITYGTEPMPESTLKALNKIFPNTKLQQTYGLSEIGILRSKSRSNDSLWVKVGGEDYDLRVVDGLLEIKAKTAMLGYLNAPSPFTEDGWFKTGDLVEQDGEWLRILGRKSDLINVGGEKVYPAEVESILQGMPEVAEASITKESHPLVGQVVVAKLRLSDVEMKRSEFMNKMKEYYKENGIPIYKAPTKIKLTKSTLCTNRFKKEH